MAVALSHRNGPFCSKMNIFSRILRHPTLHQADSHNQWVTAVGFGLATVLHVVADGCLILLQILTLYALPFGTTIGLYNIEALSVYAAFT